MKKIIIADALKDFVQQKVSALTRCGDKIVYIESGREALTIHRKEQADLIIIKPDVPDMTCEQLCSAVRGDEGLKRFNTYGLFRQTVRHREMPEMRSK